MQTTSFDLIINRPEHLSTRKKIADASITLLFWALLIYMWQPLISMLAWCFKIKIFYDHMIILGGYKDFSELLLIYSLIILALGGMLIVWAKINQFRFRGKENRKFIELVTVEREAEYFKLDALNLTQWKQYKNCRVQLNQQGEIQTVEALGEGTSADKHSHTCAVEP